MSTWGAMVQRISDEVGRDNLDDDHIKKAIISAISDYRYKRFWFNESTFTLATVNGTSDYDQANAPTLPSGLLEIDELRLSKNNSFYEMPRLPFRELRRLNNSTTLKGVPQYWTWHHKSLILYPTPDAAYTLYGDYLNDIGTPSYTWNGTVWAFLDPSAAAMTDAYTSSWFTLAEQLIRSHAKFLLYGEYLGNATRAAESFALASREYDVLIAHSEQYSMPERVTPFYG